MALDSNLGEILYSYTNPSNDKNLFTYDKTANAVLSIEKPTSTKHKGFGIIEKTYLLLNDDVFKDIKGLAIDVNGSNREVNMYLLAGKTIWKVQL
jgi:hypothetical protein